MHFHSMVKSKSQIRHLIISQDLFYWPQVTMNIFVDWSISITSRSTTRKRIGCVVMLLNSSGMDQYLHTNTSKYGVWESTSPMGVSKERILMIDHDRRQESMWNKVFYMTWLDWVEDLNKSVWKLSIKFDKWKNIENCNILE